MICYNAWISVFFVCASCILFAMFSDSKQVCKSPRISGRTKQWWTKYFQLQWMGLRCTTKNGRNFATLHQMRPMEKWVYLQTWMAGILWDQCNVGKYAIVPWRKCGFRIVIFQIFPSFRLQNLRFHIDDFLGVSPGRRRPHRLACRSESFPALGVPAGCSRQNGLKLGINSSHL